MASMYGAFLLRCWRLNGGVERIEVAHIQSGERTRVASVAAALDWIRDHSDCASTPSPAERDEGQRAKGGPTENDRV